MPVSQHVKNKRALRKLFTKTEKHLPPQALQDLRKMVEKFGGPTSQRAFEGGDITIFSFASSRSAVCFFSWGGYGVDDFCSDLSMDPDRIQEENSSQYLQGTNLHSFYSDCLYFEEKHNNSMILGHFNTYSGKKPVLDALPEPRERFISLLYFGAVYGVQLVRWSK